MNPEPPAPDQTHQADGVQASGDEWSDRLLRRWPWLIGGAMIGAVIGLVLSLVLAPRYESSAVMAININYGLTAPLELIVEDRVYDRVWQVLMSDSTLTQVLPALESDPMAVATWPDVAALRDSMGLDQRLSGGVLW